MVIYGKDELREAESQNKKARKKQKSMEKRVITKAAISIGLACPSVKNHRCQYL
jgi:hypothetical protein